MEGENMELSFSNGRFVYNPGGLNYQEILDDFDKAKTIRIITYNISGKENQDQLLQKLHKASKTAEIQIITNIPSRFESYYSSLAGQSMRNRAKDNIEVYLKKLKPNTFGTDFIPYFNFANHAKIIGTENKVYIGSANFSNESRYNIETGIIIEDRDFIYKLYSDFFETIKKNSTPYFDDDFNVLRLLVISLLTKFQIHHQKIIDKIFVHNPYTQKYEFIGGEALFSDEDLTELVLDFNGFHGLDIKAENTYFEEDDDYNDDIFAAIEQIEAIDISWLIEISSTDDCFYNWVNFDYQSVWNECLEEYSAEAYDEYLEQYIDKAKDDVDDRLREVTQEFENVADTFLSEIQKIIAVLIRINEIINQYSSKHINREIDNT
ncbi:phospholipase D-like domain-containing protein [Desulfitobacterium sp. Sab5]|uniref:phospholipase D-like domain-containing protein n=1 Tax=Desulfitobacterium nosdiversum TaxID=3375356 RepID=UPI003CFAC59B